ncbi:MAG: N-acetylmuramoyl-L-alanine amidase [Verrucomicrobiota bacterium]
MVNPLHRTKEIIAIMIAVWLCGVHLAEARSWKIVKVNDREYVTDSNIRSFYGFANVMAKGNERFFQDSKVSMRWKAGSQEMFINNTKLSLSFPVIQSGGTTMVSTVDLAKLIDPLIRPSYIRKPIVFDTVIIDPGHGGHDSGAIGKYGKEKNYTLDTALRLEQILLKNGLKTILTRRSDVYISLGQRVNFANQQKKAIFVSLHYNHATPSAKGLETFALAPQGTTPTHGGSSYWSSPLKGNERDAENIALAAAVHAQVIYDQNAYKLSPVDRGIKRARYNVLRGINKPAMLFEGGFVSNSSEGKLINDPNHRQRLAQSIATGILRFRSAVGK